MWPTATDFVAWSISQCFGYDRELCKKRVSQLRCHFGMWTSEPRIRWEPSSPWEWKILGNGRLQSSWPLGTTNSALQELMWRTARINVAACYDGDQ